MSTKEIELRIQLEKELEALVDGLASITLALEEETEYPLWVWQYDDKPQEGRKEALRIMNLLEYEPEQDPQRTIICPALIGTRAETLEKIILVNERKTQIKKTMQTMDAMKITIYDEEKETEVAKSLLRVALASLGRAKLHRRQTTRKFEVLDFYPHNIGYSWAHTRKIQRISVEEVIAKLEERQEKSPYDNYLAHQIELARAIPIDEPLAFVEPPHIHPRVNIFWQDESKKMQRIQKRGTMPIFFESKSNIPLPKLTPLPLDKTLQIKRNRRNDQSVEDVPYIASLHIHRYIKPPKE